MEGDWALGMGKYVERSISEGEADRSEQRALPFHRRCATTDATKKGTPNEANRIMGRKEGRNHRVRHEQHNMT